MISSHIPKCTSRLVTLIPNRRNFIASLYQHTFRRDHKIRQALCLWWLFDDAQVPRPKHVPESFPFSIKYNFVTNYAYKLCTYKRLRSAPSKRFGMQIKLVQEDYSTSYTSLQVQVQVHVPVKALIRQFISVY